MDYELHMKRCYELAISAGKKGFDDLRSGTRTQWKDY